MLELEQTELEQKKALDREAHIKQVLLSIRRVDPIIVEENEEHALIQRVCEQLTATPGYYNAWIALLDEKDISQRRIAQESLQQLSEQSRTVSWMVDTQGLFTSVSDVAKTVWGYEPEELAGKKHFYDLCPEAERNAFKNTIFRACTRKAPFMNIENRVQTKSGEILWMNTNGIPFFNDEGRLMGYRGRDTDITERKRSEKAIREREQFLSTLLETTVDGFWVVDPSGRIIEANQAISKMTGYAHEKLLGAHINDIDALETPEATGERMQRIIDNGYEIFETRLRCKDRQLLPVEISSTYLDLEGGRFVCFCRDLTAHKKAEAALIESKAQVRRKLQALIDPDEAISELSLADIVATEEIRALMENLYQCLGVLFMSGYPADAIAHRGVLESGVDFIQKPFSKKELTSRVRRMLEKSTVDKKNRAAAGRSTLERDQQYDTEY